MERLFQKFKENWGLREEIEAFNNYLKNPHWILIDEVPGSHRDLVNTEVGACIRSRSSEEVKIEACLLDFFQVLKRSQREKHLEQFEIDGGSHGVIYPLFSDEKTIGFIVLCGLEEPMDPDLQKIFIAFTNSVLRESRKEEEIEDINMTIRPRTIALSTVHTVHRLMTSTFDLDELLPRIARLSLQVLRANRCSIKLVDKKRKVLLPKTTIDLRQKKTKLKKVQIGKYAPGRAVKQENPVRGKNYLACPMIDEEVVGVITLYDKLDGKEFTYFDEEIMKTLSEQAAIAIKNAQLFNEQSELTLSSIRCIAQLIQDKPHASNRAETSFLRLIKIMGRKFSMNETETKTLQYAAMLHDAGQISVPEKVLLKRGELTGHEYAMVKKHPLKGAAMLSGFKPLKCIIPIIKHHHENFDGTGYPKGLRGKDIPLAARILAVVSAFEAMITDKPYRKALTITAAIKELQKNANTQFDPRVVDVFCEAVCRKDIKKLLEKELGKRGK